VDEERYQHWVSRGAQPSGTVKSLMRALSRAEAGAASDAS